MPRDRIFAILFLIALNPVFWGLFEQAGGSLNLYTDRFVDRAACRRRSSSRSTRSTSSCSRRCSPGCG
jgi:dipeptide/tripeptide permease